MFFDTPTSNSGKGRVGRSEGRRAGDRADLALLAQVERLWRTQIGRAQLPQRSDIDPSALGAALPHTMILERIAPGMARVRLAGQALHQMFDMDVRGMPASILVTPDSRTALGAQIEAVFSGPAIVEVPLQIARGWGRKPVAARLLMLPMRDGGGCCTRALAVLAVQDGNVPRGQARMTIDAEGAFRCTVLPTPAAELTPRPGADRRKPLQVPTMEEALPVRSALPLFGIIEGGRTEKSHEDATGELSEPRPALRLVVSNEAPVN